MATTTTRLTAMAVSGLVILGAAGAALAAWTLNGSGDAQARAGSATALTVTSAGVPAGGLTPGNSATVVLNVQNENLFPVRITRIKLADVRSGTPGCDAADNLDINNAAALPDEADRTLPAGNAESPASAVIAWAGPLRMKADPDDACQGAPFTFTVRLDAASAAR